MRWPGPCSQLARVCQSLGAKTTTGRRKKTPVTSSKTMPPTRLKGRRKPPAPRATPRPVSAAARPAARLAAGLALRLASRLVASGAPRFVCGLAVGWPSPDDACPDDACPDDVPPARRCPAARPAMRTPMPKARPMVCGLIPFMMLAAIHFPVSCLPYLELVLARLPIASFRHRNYGSRTVCRSVS